MAEKKTNGRMVVTTHLLACADTAEATPVCPPPDSNLPAALGVFVALDIGNLPRQEEEGHCQRVDHHSGHHNNHDRDDLSVDEIALDAISYDCGAVLEPLVRSHTGKGKSVDW